MIDCLDSNYSLIGELDLETNCVVFEFDLE